MNIDRRKHYVMVLDTETANTLMDSNGKMDMSSVLMYDIGWSVVDTKGGVYVERSFINSDIFYHERKLMQSAYYAWKIPQYEQDILNGTRTVASLYQIRQQFLKDLETFRVKEVAAHNARFDYNALNGTSRYTTQSRLRYWFPFEVEMWDTLKMARDVILKMPTYKAFCEKYELLTKRGQLSATAESLYKFITNNPNFVESHTALEDVQIEREILWYCLKQHKPMRKKLYENSVEFPKPTQFQRELMDVIKKNCKSVL